MQAVSIIFNKLIQAGVCFLNRSCVNSALIQQEYSKYWERKEAQEAAAGQVFKREIKTPTLFLANKSSIF